MSPAPKLGKLDPAARRDARAERKAKQPETRDGATRPHRRHTSDTTRPHRRHAPDTPHAVPALPGTTRRGAALKHALRRMFQKPWK